MQLPYQCHRQCGSVLVAARGSNIDSFSLLDGSLLSTWRCSPIQVHEGSTPRQKHPGAQGEQEDLSNQNVDSQSNETSPPAKKRRLSSFNVDQKPLSDVDTPRSEKKKSNKNRRATLNASLDTPAIILLSVTRNEKHVIAVTGEDKAIRVFDAISNNENGNLKFDLVQISQRVMPKRPCAIALSDDDTTIISADKFGDVYAIPLLILDSSCDSISVVNLKSNLSDAVVTTRPFVPAANTLTVHSMRNRKALENQKKQTNKPPEKLETTFERQLLLGHVSMLTDILVTNINDRNYIITADRDEHIRVSRGIPNAHIIEGFCLGHTEFVSRLCIPGTYPNLLISGGGEDYLLLWDWLSGRLLHKVYFKEHFEVAQVQNDAALDKNTVQERSRLSISQIIHISISSSIQLIAITCEAVPLLVTFLMTEGGELQHLQTLSLPGNPFSITNTQGTKDSKGVEISATNLIVSFDTVHKSGSTNELRDEADSESKPLQAYKFGANGLMEPIESSSLRFTEGSDFDGFNEQNLSYSEMGHLIKSSFYGLENLRKRDDDGDAPDVAQENC